MRLMKGKLYITKGGETDDIQYIKLVLFHNFGYISRLPGIYITDFVTIFVTFDKNPYKMNSRINLTTDLISGFSHFDPLK